MEKWIKKYISDEEKKKREAEYKKLTSEEKKDLKKQKIKQITETKVEKGIETPPQKDFLTQIMEFKNWLENRNYLAGDLDKIAVWIKNLYSTLNSEILDHTPNENAKNELYEKYKEIPPSFLEEKVRIALNRRLKGITSNSSDSYYLRKLKNTINMKLKEAEYYNILREILKS